MNILEQSLDTIFNTTSKNNGIEITASKNEILGLAKLAYQFKKRNPHFDELLINNNVSIQNQKVTLYTVFCDGNLQSDTFFTYRDFTIDNLQILVDFTFKKEYNFNEYIILKHLLEIKKHIQSNPNEKFTILYVGIYRDIV